MSWWGILILMVAGYLIFKFLVKPFFKILAFAALCIAVYFLFFNPF